MKTVLSIDPGREKCGVAVVGEGGILHMSVVPRAEMAKRTADLCAELSPDLVIIGNGTGGSTLAEELEQYIKLPIMLVDEHLTSQRARKRYFQANPPKGLLFLVPRGLLTPSVPYDDYTALIIAEDYLNKQ